MIHAHRLILKESQICTSRLLEIAKNPKSFEKSKVEATGREYFRVNFSHISFKITNFEENTGILQAPRGKWKNIESDNDNILEDYFVARTFPKIVRNAIFY